jgi:hypothetical protein
MTIINLDKANIIVLQIIPTVHVKQILKNSPNTYEILTAEKLKRMGQEKYLKGD